MEITSYQINKQEAVLFESIFEIYGELANVESTIAGSLLIGLPIALADCSKLPEDMSINGSLLFTKELKLIKLEKDTSVYYSTKLALTKGASKTTVYFSEKTGLFILKFRHWKERESFRSELKAELAILMGYAIPPGKTATRKPDEKLQTLIREYKEIMQQKNAAVKQQQYEDAANLRDAENKKHDELFSYLQGEYPENKLFQNPICRDSLIQAAY